MSDNGKLNGIMRTNRKKPIKKNPFKGTLYTSEGQWRYPGEITKIPGNTMATHGYGNIPLWVVPNNDPARLVMPNTGQQVFPNSTNFTEYPQLPTAQYGLNTPEAWEKEIRSVEHRIGDPSGWTLENYNELQNKLNEYKAWRENTPEGRAVIDYHNEPNEYVVFPPAHLNKEKYNMKRALELGYEPDEMGHWPSVDYESGEYLKSKKHDTAWKEYLYGYIMNPDQALNYDVVVNPEGYFGENQLQYVPKKAKGGWLDAYNLPIAQYGIIGTPFIGLVNKAGNWLKNTSLNPYNWGVEDYSDLGNFSKAYEKAKKSGKEEFIFNGKRYNTKYAGTPRQEVSKYGVKGKPIHPMDIAIPTKTNIYPPYGRYISGHIEASVIDDAEAPSVNYSSFGNYPFGLRTVDPSRGEKTYFSYGVDPDKFVNKVASLPLGDYGFLAEGDYQPSTWNLFTNNCADNVCDAFGVPRDKGLTYPAEALEKIKEKYPTLDVTGRTEDDYRNFVTNLLRQRLNPNAKTLDKDVLNNVDKLTSIYYSPDSNLRLKFDIADLIQRALVNNNYELPKSYIKGDKNNLDNIIGPETEAAIQDWKKKNKKMYGGDPSLTNLTGQYRGGGKAPDPDVARDMLLSGMSHGHPLTQKQRTYLAEIAGTDENGNFLDEEGNPTDEYGNPVDSEANLIENIEDDAMESLDEDERAAIESGIARTGGWLKKYQDGGLIPDLNFLNKDFKKWDNEEKKLYQYLKYNYIIEPNKEIEDYITENRKQYRDIQDKLSKERESFYKTNPNATPNDFEKYAEPKGLYSDWDAFIPNLYLNNDAYDKYYGEGYKAVFYDLNQQYNPQKYLGLKSKDEYKEYLQSDKYKDIAKKFWGDNSDKFIQKQLTDIDNAQYKSFKESNIHDQLELAPGRLAAYNPIYNTINMYQGNMRKVIPHEISHLTNRNENPLSEDEAYEFKQLRPNGLIQRIPKQITDEQKKRLEMSSQFSKWKDLSNEFRTQFDKNASPEYKQYPDAIDYLADPNEVRARVNAIRSELNRKNIKWNNTGDIENYINTLPDTDEIKVQYRDLNYIDKDLKNKLFNEYAYQKANSNKSLFTGKYGGWLDTYAPGGIMNPTNPIREPSAWIGKDFYKSAKGNYSDYGFTKAPQSGYYTRDNEYFTLEPTNTLGDYGMFAAFDPTKPTPTISPNITPSTTTTATTVKKPQFSWKQIDPWDLEKRYNEMAKKGMIEIKEDKGKTYIKRLYAPGGETKPPQKLGGWLDKLPKAQVGTEQEPVQLEEVTVTPRPIYPTQFLSPKVREVMFNQKPQPQLGRSRKTEEQAKAEEARGRYIENPTLMDYVGQAGYIPYAFLHDPFSMGEMLKQARTISSDPNLDAYGRVTKGVDEIINPTLPQTLLNVAIDEGIGGLASGIIKRAIPVPQMMSNLFRNLPPKQISPVIQPSVSSATGAPGEWGTVESTVTKPNALSSNSLSALKSKHRELANISDKEIAERLEFWKTPEGESRLQSMIDNTPELKQMNITPKYYVKQLKNLGNVNRDAETMLSKIEELQASKNNLIRDFEEMDPMFRYKDQLNDELAIIDDQIKNISEAYDNLGVNTKWSQNAFLERHLIPKTRKPGSLNLDQSINPYTDINNFSTGIGVEFLPEEAEVIAGHEVTHLPQLGTTKTNLDRELEGLQLLSEENPNLFSAAEQEEIFPTTFRSFLNKKGDYFKRALDYFKKGSQGREKTPFLAEVRKDMMKKGIIKNLGDKITLDMLKKHYADYIVQPHGTKYPLRLYDIINNNSKNFKLLEKVINKLPVVLPAVGAGSYLMNQESSSPKTGEFKKGGWLNKYQ